MNQPHQGHGPVTGSVAPDENAASDCGLGFASVSDCIDAHRLRQAFNISHYFSLMPTGGCACESATAGPWIAVHGGVLCVCLPELCAIVSAHCVRQRAMDVRWRLPGVANNSERVLALCLPLHRLSGKAPSSP